MSTTAEFPGKVATRGARSTLIKRFDQIGIEDIPLVGGKNASLGEMRRALTSKGVPVPDGFATTAAAYWHFLETTGLRTEIEDSLGALDITDIHELQKRSAKIRATIVSAKLPEDFEIEIRGAYQQLCGPAGEMVAVAVRSSATAEDLPEASFAGAQETYLNIVGEEALLQACLRCFASLFYERAISYRVDKGFAHSKVALSIGVQRMVRSDVGSSGVIFTIDTESGFRDAVLINAAYGLGENVVKGSVNPDEYSVFKPTLRQGFRPILQKIIGNKEVKMIYDIGAASVKNVEVPAADRARFALNDDDILQLAGWACIIEEHYGKPMDIEFAQDGINGQLFIVQARPETVQSRRDTSVLEIYELEGKGKALFTGRSVGRKIASGPVRIIKSTDSLEDFREGEVLVAEKTDPDWEPVMKKAAAIITDRGGRTCHAAIVSRELGVPAIVGTEDGTTSLEDGQEVTVFCAGGDTGIVYDSRLPFHITRTNLQEIERPRTQIMMNVANPENAFALSFIPNDGVGLAREEFIITSYIKAHPLALLDYNKIEDLALRADLDKLTAGYDDKAQFFVDKLAQGVSMIAAAFYPKDVIVRLSDFKTNEYANLVGGRAYEPVEENPMLGFRGASRYYNPRYAAGFALECRAMKKVREEMGLTNVKLMIPFCRTVEEGRKVIAEMEKHGLKRGDNGLEVYVMCEIPSNVILAEQFAEIFDGFSIGSNDLTQLILGVDRDSEIVADIFDERNPAVKKMIANVIAVCRRKHRKIGICGQAPSDYPEFAQFLVEQGIDSISLNPDTVLKTTLAILETEKHRKNN
jgi:pyruvate,water dikinase